MIEGKILDLKLSDPAAVQQVTRETKTLDLLVIKLNASSFTQWPLGVLQVKMQTPTYHECKTNTSRPKKHIKHILHTHPLCPLHTVSTATMATQT